VRWGGEKSVWEEKGELAEVLYHWESYQVLMSTVGSTVCSIVSKDDDYCDIVT